MKASSREENAVRKCYFFLAIFEGVKSFHCVKFIGACVQIRGCEGKQIAPWFKSKYVSFFRYSNQCVFCTLTRGQIRLVDGNERKGGGFIFSTFSRNKPFPFFEFLQA